MYNSEKKMKEIFFACKKRDNRHKWSSKPRHKRSGPVLSQECAKKSPKTNCNTCYFYLFLDTLTTVLL